VPAATTLWRGVGPLQKLLFAMYRRRYHHAGNGCPIRRSPIAVVLRLFDWFTHLSAAFRAFGVEGVSLLQHLAVS